MVGNDPGEMTVKKLILNAITGKTSRRKPAPAGMNVDCAGPNTDSIQARTRAAAHHRNTARREELSLMLSLLCDR